MESGAHLFDQFCSILHNHKLYLLLQSVCCTLELQIKNLESMEITASSTRENSQDIQLKHKYGKLLH